MMITAVEEDAYLVLRYVTFFEIRFRNEMRGEDEH